ncbi:unnamed protein product [Effrenium voratum]|uniref:F-box domain-containing protein n=1 Tax=Effrenium voratum TaxID=2562239 RepID=A0AA36HUL4_9DINO|nr:unnamed protein product [Effrenium voratum]CAJ1417073.1 unnamed protein product [Effrenium voratum]
MTGLDQELLEEEDEELLLALEESLKRGGKRSNTGLHETHASSQLVRWPQEVRLCVASFLPWSEIVAYSLLCRAWRALELEDTLWQVYFAATWPRLAERREAVPDGYPQPWRVLFRAQWAKGNHTEDALEEDWLDFRAAQGLKSKPTDSSTGSRHLKIQEALQQCREDLQQVGLRVPAEADANHTCDRLCRFHRLHLEGDAFLCEVSGVLHQCAPSTPCASCVPSADDCFLVCPVSGRCFPKVNTVNEEATEAVPCHDWDPELSAAQQVGRWFEQGYFMSEEQARSAFGLGGRCSCLN